MFKSGDVVLAKIQYTDTYELKTRPAIVLFGEYDNIIVAGVTSNINMEGIPLTKKEGAVEESIIKLNYIFTITNSMISKKLFHLSIEKKKMIYNELNKKLYSLNN